MIIEQIRSARPGVSVSVTTSNIQVIGYRKNRAVAIIQNTDASIAIRVGSAAALTANKGTVVPAGGIYMHYGSGALMAIAASGTVAVSVIDMVGPGNHADTPREANVSVGTSVVRLFGRDHKRLFTTFHNAHATQNIWIGGHDAVSSTSDDILIKPGQTVQLPGGAAMWAIASGAATELRIRQERRAA